jgi:AcrR family transcriptional regulator
VNALPAQSKRDQLVTTALELFYQHGFNATGIDKIIAAAGVSKKTLYNHFKSKDELILATLRKRDEQFRNVIMRDTERLGVTAKERLISVFDAHDIWFNSKNFCGCMFINASAEFSSQQNPHHMLCVEHKRLVRNYLKALAEQTNVKDPSLLSQQLNLLLEGAIVEAHVSNNKQGAQLAKTIATTLVNNALS